MENFNIIAEQEHTTVMAHYEPLPCEDGGCQIVADIESFWTPLSDASPIWSSSWRSGRGSMSIIGTSC